MIRLAVRLRREDADRALAELVELAPSGLEEQDRGELVEYALYGVDLDLPSAEALAARLGPMLVETVSAPVPDDWADRWQAFHRPVLVSDRLYVRPPWSPPYAETPDADPSLGVRELVVDPARAFGTGGHGTTRLCLELLVELAEEQDAAGGPPAGSTRGPVLDLGCGSGVLGIAAAQLGWGPVHGLDNELASVEAMIENAAANGVTVTADRYDLLMDGAATIPGDAGDEPVAPIVLANLLRPLLLRVAADGFAGTPPQALIASGLLVHEVDGIVRAFALTGLVETERRDDGEWAAVLLRRV